MTPLQHCPTVTTDAIASSRKTTLVTAITMVMGGVSMSAQANLTTSSTLAFDPGTFIVTGCKAPAVFNGTSCTVDGTENTGANINDVGGSYFRMNQGNDPANEKTPISMFAPIHIGSVQEAGLSHTGVVDGSENPAIDNPWNFWVSTGMHTLTSPISIISDFGSTKTLDFSGWGWSWGNFGPGGTAGPNISLGSTATIVCSTSSCSDSSTYTLDMDVHVPVAFTSVPYSLHLEGKVNSAVPVPAAVWLFGSGIIGLSGVARRRRNKA